MREAGASKTLLVMAGGVLGPCVPGLAVADRPKAQGLTIHWLGTRRPDGEASWCLASGYPPISLHRHPGARGNGIKRLLAAPTVSSNPCRTARCSSTIQPDAVVLGMGLRLARVAWLPGCPAFRLLHE